MLMQVGMLYHLSSASTNVHIIGNVCHTILHMQSSQHLQLARQSLAYARKVRVHAPFKFSNLFHAPRGPHILPAVFCLLGVAQVPASFSTHVNKGSQQTGFTFESEASTFWLF
jgi:hypothetical protein